MPDLPMRAAQPDARWRVQQAEVQLTVRNYEAAQPSREALECSGLTLYGSRVRKDGSLGADHHERIYTRLIPGWAAELAAETVKRAREGTLGFYWYCGCVDKISATAVPCVPGDPHPDASLDCGWKPKAAA